MNYGSVIKSGEAPVAVWGTGYIGYSTMAYFGAAGVRCVGYDVDQARVAQVNAGELPVPGIDGWLEVDPRPLVAKGLVSATASPDDPVLGDALVHFIAVPTENGGRPYWKPLEDVIGRIAR